MSLSRWTVAPLLLALTGCAAGPPAVPEPLADYRRALEAAPAEPFAAGSEEERAAVERFSVLFDEFTPEAIRRGVRETYAEGVYFHDTLKEIVGRDAVEEYLVETAEAVTSLRVEIEDVASSDGDYYFRWVMDVGYRQLAEGRTVRTLGMSHVRFDQQGRVILQRDYWDSAAGLFEHVPLVGWAIRRIKSRL